MPWRHWWHSWLTRNWDEDDWYGWKGTTLRCIYLTLAMLLTLLVSPSLLTMFLRSFTLGMVVATAVFGAYSWVVVAHYPEPAPEGA